MRALHLLAAVSLFCLCLGQSSDADLPDYIHFPTYTIDLDLAPEDRYTQVALDFKDGIVDLMTAYLHLAPRFMRNFFEDNIDTMKLRHLEHYREIAGMAETVGIDVTTAYMLNFAYEMADVLCTSIVARTPEGHVIHGRNLDFGFPDKSRNVTFIAQFYRNGEHLYDAVMIAGYLGVLTAYREGAWSMSMNHRGEQKSIETRFEILGKIYMGEQDVGFYLRDLLYDIKDYQTMIDTLPYGKTILPMFLIMSGPGVNQGAVVSKDFEGPADISVIDDETWYLVQTNDDHFAGVCQQRCLDAHEHMQTLGADSVNLETLLEEVMLQSHNFNQFTIHTSMYDTAAKYQMSYGFDTDMPYVRQAAPPTDLYF